MIDWTAKRGVCPSCGRDGEGRSNGTLGIGRFHEGPRRGDLVAHCHRCGQVAWPDDPARAEPAVARQVNDEKHSTLSEFGHELWKACRPLGGEALAYLMNRSCALPPTDGDLRWHPSLKHSPSGTAGPALVALVTDAVTRQPLTLHRTWIRADGTKAQLNPPRMLLGGHRKAGGVIRLWPDEAVSTGLGIAEGLETALSLAHALQPVWSLIDAGNLAALPVLFGVETLVIGADHDDAGLKAAGACADRWIAAGVDVRVIAPRAMRADWNTGAAA